MFSPEMEVSREAAGVAGNFRVPKLFKWRHGGSRVLLSGSFTGWLEHLPMYPMEGCPDVFQAICSIPPGLHQYKFCVDGVWKYDNSEPFVTGTYGIVNTVFVDRETDFVSTMLSLGTPNSTTNMDVENEAYHHVVTVSDGSMKDATPRISDSDLKISRARISEFLSTHTAYQLLPDSGHVLTLDLELPVRQAFHILYEQGISVAPLWDCTRGQFVGVLSALDFILILRELGNHGSNLTDEELATHTISAWKDIKRQMYWRMDEYEGSFRRCLVHAGPFDSLKNVAHKIVQNEISTIPIINSSAENGSLPQLLHLASLSGILKCICRHFKKSSSSLPIIHQPVCTMPLGTWVPQIGDPNGRPLAILRPNASLSSALSLLVEAQISSIPIVDDNDSLVDTFSRSDITSLAKDRIYERVRLDELSIHQALQLAQDASSPHRFYNGQRCQMCLRTDSLLKIMERVANPGVRRVIIVEAGSNRVEGIISLRDIFKFLLG